MADPTNGDITTTTIAQGWMSDVQRAIALLIIGLLVFASAALVLRLVVSADIVSILDLTKIMLAALVNMGLIALGFFFGNNQAKAVSDAGQQKIVEKLTSTQPPGPAGPVAPVAAPVVVASWWSLLTTAEQTAIDAAASAVPPDARVQAILAALKSGKAEAPDLADLVTKGLLTPDRAKAISG
jgi:hypothetical protein